MNHNHVFFKTKNSLNSELSHLWFVLRRSGSWSDLLFCDFWWNIWFWQCDFLLTQCLYKYSCFSLLSVWVRLLCLHAGFELWLTDLYHFSAIGLYRKTQIYFFNKKTQEVPCGLLLKLTVTPQYAITVITHSCPINNTAVIFYWIECNWGCWKCKGDLGLKLEVG